MQRMEWKWSEILDGSQSRPRSYLRRANGSATIPRVQVSSSAYSGLLYCRLKQSKRVQKISHLQILIVEDMIEILKIEPRF